MIDKQKIQALIYLTDTLDMTQSALEENNVDKAIVYKWTKRKKV